MSGAEEINLYSPEETWTDTSVALLWDKPDEKVCGRSVTYMIYVNDELVGSTRNTDYTLHHLEALKTYKICLHAMTNDQEKLISNMIQIRIRAEAKLFDITAFGQLEMGLL